MKSVLDIYIDFEAIRSTFKFRNKRFKSKRAIPFAYTIGYFDNHNVFNHKTTIVDFRQNKTYEKIASDLKEKLKDDIFSIMQSLDFEKINFLAFAPNLEKTLLSEFFGPNISVSSIFHSEEVSLLALTKHEFKKSYFSFLKTLVAKEYSEMEIKKYGLDQDGALASFCGFLLLINNWKITNLLTFEEQQKLLNELAEYSEDDVLRLQFLSLHPEIVNNRFNQIVKLRSFKRSVTLHSLELFNLAQNLKKYNFDDNMTIGELKKSIESDIKEKKEIEKIIQERINKVV
ncbi:unknown; predicted coding region [Mycoplasmopsis pulmonis]|uniref:DUF2779 domain-containing protein n=1 Tax=Mycoplasmopsis pulmonis (strain UAB CTIP) TaxID=272635 RepID=Q98QT7_MYCPU|nr:hypothetical protein [Mycoplasmopsis pulmonis]MDZ7293233.1 hypothetical protein [Mycoplasmopsis pulmonis]CAC13447.1 unknown; predicted coding region [Mycoplasmopsis pulmonis]VEU68035.1 Uncharacterised protein [Mycoplasmopsis pulmonis]